jgi:uncharacterized caspase-like protein
MLSQAGASCDPKRQATVRALLVGVSRYEDKRFPRLDGPENDVRMLGNALQRLGVEVRATPSIGHRDFMREVANLVQAAQCGDTVIVSFGGNSDPSTRSPVMLFSDANADTCSVDRMKTAPYFGDPAPRAGERVIAEGCIDADELVLVSEVLSERGVNFFLIYDAPASRELADRFLERTDGRWIWKPWQEKGRAGQQPVGRGSRGLLLAPTYAEEIRPPGSGLMYGAWTYALSTALLSEARDVSFRRLAEATAREHSKLVKAAYVREINSPVFAATHPDRPLLATGSTDRASATQVRGQQDQRRIQIDSPAVATRGAVPVRSNQVAIEGRVIAPQKARAVQVNQQEARLNADGSFVARVPVSRGENRLTIVAWLDGDEFIPATFTVIGTPDDQLGDIGRRYALVIGNQAYQDGAFSPLQTPHEDARAVAQVLQQRYGFITQLPAAGGTARPLVLLDASKHAIERTLSALRNVLQPEDSLLIYFAGHGLFERETRRAYWLPVDAEQNEPTTWLEAEAVVTAIQRLNVRHVLVVADSCFSGAVQMRSAEAAAPGRVERQHFLAQRMTRPSRQFITAGGNEPVLDGGGGGHSVFARAFLDALRSEKEAFTASELQTRHLAPRVGGNAKQQPQQFPMREHEGGDLVFVPRGS